MHHTLGSDAPGAFFHFHYLLVLFIAELLSSAALLLHCWSTRASERVPTAPWLTLLLLLLLLCVLYVLKCSGQQERTQDRELLGVKASTCQSSTKLKSLNCVYQTSLCASQPSSLSEDISTTSEQQNRPHAPSSCNKADMVREKSLRQASK